MIPTNKWEAKMSVTILVNRVYEVQHEIHDNKNEHQVKDRENKLHPSLKKERL